MKQIENFEKEYANLNPEQKKAVDTLQWPVMVIAWPGTGKTQIIGLRTANILLKAWVNPENILITTFTEAWVIAIRERLIRMIGNEAYKVQVSTIHSFSQDIIKTFPEKFTQEKLDTAIDEVDSLEIVSDIVLWLLEKAELENLTSYGDKLFYVKSIKDALSNLKREWVSQVDLRNKIEEEKIKSEEYLVEKRNNKRIKNIEKYEKDEKEKIGKLEELLKIYSLYQKTLREKWVYDFNDMINFVLEKFKEDEDMRYYYAEKYQYIMLDEYQDTNNPQNEIIDLILSVWENRNLMVVGDDDQSIYRFQWANIENMLDFTSKYNDATIIVLDKNYRSTQPILDAAKALIENNKERLINRIPWLEKNLISQKSKWSETDLNIFGAKNDIDEKKYVVDTIKAYLDKWIKAEEIAIIVRNNREVEVYSKLLQDHNYEVTSKLDTNILKNDFVKLILRFLEIIDNPSIDDEKLLSLLRSSFTEIESIDIFEINKYLYNANYSKRGDKLKIMDVLLHLDSYEIPLKKKEKLEKFTRDLFELTKKFADHNMYHAFSSLLETLKVIEKIESIWNFDDIQDIYTLSNLIKDFMKYDKNLTIKKFIKKIALYEKYEIRIERQVIRAKEKWIQVLTAHSSKWLEYEVVCIPWLYTWNWDGKTVRSLINLPEWIAWAWLQAELLRSLSEKEKKDHENEKRTEEDRRLFFVALTRAKSFLHLSYPCVIKNKLNIISPFISELNNIELIESKTKDEEIQKEVKNEIIEDSRLINYSNLELEYIENFLKNYRLSASDLNTFLISPKDFLYRSIFKYPFIENENTVFWTCYHKALELFYKKLLESGEVPPYSFFEFVFLKWLEKELLTSEEFERLKKRWIESLKGYYETYKWSFNPPLKTEYKFSRKNIFFENIPITWIIDKIELVSWDFTKDFSGGSLFRQAIKITDYKTWSFKYIGEIKWQNKDWVKDDDFERGKYGRQLMFYRLLYENDSELNSMYDLVSLELDFCEWKKWDFRKIEVDFTEDEYQEFKNLTIDTWKKLSNIDFWKNFLQVK